MTHQMFAYQVASNKRLLSLKRPKYPFELITLSIVVRPEHVHRDNGYHIVYVPFPNDGKYYWLFETEADRASFKNKYAPEAK